MKYPDTSYRAHQIDLCIERKGDFLNYWVIDGELSLPKKMEQCKLIKKLKLIGSNECTLKDISLIEEFTKIEYLSFEGILTINDFSSILKLPNLKGLEIFNSDLNIDIIEKLPLLDELHLSNYNGPIIIDCKKLEKQTNLKHLSLECIDYFNEESLTELSDLISLRLRRHIPEPNSKTLDFLKQFPNLSELNIAILICSGYSNVDALIQLPNLKKLSITDYVAEDELKYQNRDWLTINFLNNVSSLENLKLKDCWLSDENNIDNRLSTIKNLEIIK